MAGELLLDTGALVSLLDRSQTRHSEFARFFENWSGAVVSTEADVGSVPLKPLPTLDEVVGSTAARPLKADALVGHTSIRLPTLVRPGDLVVTRVRVGVVVVAGHTTATETGHLGEVIGLINEQSGRRLQGRVVAAGEVEVVH